MIECGHSGRLGSCGMLWGVDWEVVRGVGTHCSSAMGSCNGYAMGYVGTDGKQGRSRVCSLNVVECDALSRKHL